MISFVFFLSGSSALIFETVWFRTASTVLGSSIWSAAAVLMSFMAGLGIGNTMMMLYGKKIKNPFIVYVIIELIIGVSGVSVIVFLPVISPVISQLLSEFVGKGGLLHFVRFAITFSAFLIPAVAMGATLPVLQKGLYFYDHSFVRSLGRLYGWNTIGAVFGTLLTEYFLIGYFGILNTALIACAFNFTAAYLLFHNFRHRLFSLVEDDNRDIRLKTSGIKLILLAPFMTGLALLALEVIWFRLLLLFHIGSSRVFAIMLAVVLVGIGVGGLISTKLKIRNKNIDSLLLYLPIIAATTVVLTFYLTLEMAGYFISVIFANIYLFPLLAILLMLPTSTISGVLFPLYGEKLYQKLGNSTQSTGVLTLVNTAGATIGSGIATFLLLPKFGISISIFLMAFLYLIISLISPGYIKGRFIRHYFPPIIAVMLLIIIFPFQGMQKIYLIFSARVLPNERLIKVKEGLNETLQFYQFESFGQPRAYRLVTNAYSMSATNFYAQRYMKLFVYLPYMLDSNIKDVLLISYGVGNTAEAVTSLPTMQHFDVVDTSKDIYDLSYIFHNMSRSYPLKDKRTVKYIEDGRFYLQTTKRKYDLITGEPPPPKSAGIVNLYTQEYFHLIRNRLNPGGIVSYWLPLHALYDSDTLAITKAFCNVFGDCSLWSGSGFDLILLGSNGALKAVTRKQFYDVWHSKIGNELKSIGVEFPGQIGAMFIADNRLLKRITDKFQPVLDNYPHRISPDTRVLHKFSELNSYLLNYKRREQRFKHSSFVKSILPKKVIQNSLKFFRYDYLLSLTSLKVFNKRGDMKFEYWQELANLLSNSNLKVLPLLMLGASPAHLAIYHSIPYRNTREYIKTTISEQLMNRKYLLASKTLKQYVMKYKQDRNIKYFYKLYFLTKALGRDLNLRELKKAAAPGGPLSGDVRFVSWLQKNYVSSGNNGAVKSTVTL